MGKAPLISVIVPIYNVEDYIKNALTSLEKQDFTDFEVIMIDDNSSDASYDIAREFVKRDKRFALLKNTTNQGLAETRNIGMKFAKGMWLYFFDSDDILPQNLFSLIKPFMGEKNDMICFNSFSFDANTKLSKTAQIKTTMKITGNEAISDFINNKIEMTAWSYITRKSLIELNRIRFSKGRLFEDGNFLVKLLCYAKSIDLVECLPGAYFYRRFRQGSIMYKVSRQRTLKQFEDSVFISKDIASTLEENSKIDNTEVKKYIISSFLRLGFEYANVLVNNRNLRLSLIKLIQDKSNKYNYRFSKKESLKIAVLRSSFFYHLRYLVAKLHLR